ncbi:cytochrome c oxidase subunit 3 family protein [Cohaesibacter celericrescens]|uniref:Copper oxidase n=1 Tax=Cohaesibacter celericrescens TaxID=2067669 RepID=A0A2N5XSJ8_9HYPH|nr:cytochrome c oxidase subunit 3 family protein [Cohaesibacter celericrescens]PLW77496.1 copper oxidase [Cohaesibacter celericrescens]
MSDSVTTEQEDSGGWGALDSLPGDPMMWVLIVSELLVFGAFFLSFAVSRVMEPDSFAQSQSLLDGVLGGINTIVLITSGFLCALALLALEGGKVAKTRMLLSAAIILGGIFCCIKILEYVDKYEQGIGVETNSFFTLFFLMTGFHFMHVLFGMVLLGIGIWRPRHATIETVCAFWHMVDLIWVLLYPLVYLAR